MKNYPLIFGLFCTMAIVATILLRPDPRVQFEAEVMHLKPEEALVLLDRFADERAYHDTLKLTHARLALDAGDLDHARQSFSELLSAEKPSPDILDYLSEIALLENELSEAAELAGRAQDIRPTDARRQRLGYWYRLLKNEEAEMAVLSMVTPEVLTQWEVMRLGQLYLHRDDDAAYERLLVGLANSRREDSVKFQQRLIQFYIATDQFEAAKRTAFERYAKMDHDTALVQFTLAGLIEKGAIDPAQALAIGVLRDDPGVGHTLVAPFSRAGHGGIARFLQGSWLASADTLTAEQWTALSDFAEMTGDLSGLRRALVRLGPGSAEQIPGTVFMQFVRYGGARALVPFRPYLTPEVLKENPLVAAAWSGWTNDPGMTYTHLVHAAGLSLSDCDRSIWMSIAEGLKGTRYFSNLLAGAAADPQLRTMLRATIIRESAAPSDG